MPIEILVIKQSSLPVEVVVEGDNLPRSDEKKANCIHVAMPCWIISVRNKSHKFLHDEGIDKDKNIVENFEACACDKVITERGPNEAENRHFEWLALSLTACFASFQVLVKAIMAVLGTVVFSDLPDVI